MKKTPKSKMKKVLIYGMGYYGRKLLVTAEKYGVAINGFLDTYKSQNEVQGVPLLDVDKIDNKDEYIVIIAVASNSSFCKIYFSLKDKGFKSIYYYLMKDKCFSGDFWNGECIKMDTIDKNTLPYVEMHVVDHCNLNCKGCTHFSALYNKQFPKFENRIRDVERVNNIFSNIFIFCLLGGEPLLNPELDRYLDNIRVLLPNTELRLTTNGLLIPSLDEKTLLSIARNNVTVVISEYQPTHEIIHRIEERLNKYKIDYNVRKYSSKDKFMVPLKQNVDLDYPNICVARGCTTIHEGYIGKCPLTFHVKQLNKYFGTEFPSNEVINLYDDISASEILERLAENISLCEYCIDSTMDWSRCDRKIKLEDFIRVK